MPSCSRIENFLLRCTKLVIYVIPILPLYISSSVMFPFITGKNFAFRILVELAAALWLGLMATNKMYRLQNSFMVTAVLIFTFVVGLADLLGVDPYNSFWSNYERMEGYITVLHLALYFIIIKSIFRITKDWTIFFSIFLTVSALAGLFTFIEPNAIRTASNYVMEYGTRKAGTIGNPPFLASYLLFSVFLGFILICNIQKLYLKLFCVVFIMLNSIVIYLTASRGAIITAVIGLVITSIYLIFWRIRMSYTEGFRKILPVVVGLLIISAVVFWTYRNISMIKDDKTISRLMMMSLSDPSIETRLDAWKMAWNGIKEKPVLGWGQENFIGVYTVNPIPVGKRLVWLDRAHNIIIDWLVNAGILGLFSFLAIYGTAFYILKNNLRKKIISKNETLIITSAIIVYFIQNLFTFDTISSYLIFFALMAFIDNIESIKSTVYLSSQNNVFWNKEKIKSLSISLVAVTVFAFVGYHINYIPIKQLQSYSQINMSLTKYKSFSKMLDDFNKALSYKAFGDNHIREVMTSVSNQIFDHQLYRTEGASEFIQRTAEEMEKGLATNRYNLEYITNAFYFYKLLALYEPSFITVAETLIKECLRINPHFQWAETAMLDVFLIKRDYEKAFNHAKRILELQPNSDSIQFKLALAAILTSRGEIEKEALEKVKKIRMVKNKNIVEGKVSFLLVKELYQLAQAHMEARHYDKALQYYKKIISILYNQNEGHFLKDKYKNTIKASFHLEIAKVFILLGDRKNASKEAKKAAELDPVNFGDEETFID